MRKKESCYILTFQSTVQAIEMEKALKERNAPGRLIPVPGEITAGCGLAYCVPASQADLLQKMIVEYGLAYQEHHEILL